MILHAKLLGLNAAPVLERLWAVVKAHGEDSDAQYRTLQQLMQVLIDTDSFEKISALGYFEQMQPLINAERDGFEKLKKKV